MKETQNDMVKFQTQKDKKEHSDNGHTNFNVFFTSIKETHNYNTRLSSRMTYALPKTRRNYGIFVDALGKHPLCHRMCKVTKETLGANNIMRNVIDSTSITFRWTSSSSRQSVFSTTTIAKKTEGNGSQSRKTDYLVKIGPCTSEPLLG